MDCLAVARPMSETRYANSAGVHIAYQLVGDGPLDVLFVMGWVTNMDYFWQEPGFARFLRRLASFSRLIMVDKRGTGLSDRVAGLPTLEERVDDIRVVMDAVGSKRAALVGVSERGTMAILFAATYPERTSNLVLIGTAPRWQWAPDWPWSPTQREINAHLKAIERGFGTVEWATRDLERRAPSMAGDKEFQRWWMTYMRMGASPGAAIALALMNTMIDNRHILPSIRVPTLIVHRAGDVIARVEAARYMAANIPGARYVELPGDEHLPFVGDQDEILTPIEEFLGARHSTADPDTVLATALLLKSATAGRPWPVLANAAGRIFNVPSPRSVTAQSTLDADER
jgi:pimeloyl-ACP methyl ester carboxylesterase